MVGPKKKKGGKRRSGQKTPAISRAITTLDESARAYARLLMDPCNSPLVTPPYAGYGTGLYRRVRRYINVPATDQYACYVFTPGRNLYYQWSATGDSNVSFSSPAANITNSIAGYAQIRCLAACLKVRYVGAESARAGVVGLYSGPQLYQPGVPVGTTSDNIMAMFPSVSRLGELHHEVKWVPASADQDMSPSNLQTFENVVPHSSVAVILRGIPAGSVQLEFTMAYEQEGEILSSGTGNITTVSPPTSRNSLNDVLRVLGPVSNWAYNTIGAPVIRGTINALGAMTQSALTQSQASSMAALTFL